MYWLIYTLLKTPEDLRFINLIIWKIFRKTNISHTQLRNAFEAVYRKLLTKDLIKTSKCMIIRFKSHKFQSYF